MAEGLDQPGQTPAVPALPDVRASDHERQATVDALKQACGVGLITLDEFSDRVAVALAAGTRAQLDRVVADLPVPSPAPLPEPRRRRPSRWVVAVMSANNRKGRWRTSGRTYAVAVMGGCHLDLRQAEFDSPTIEIIAVAIMGGIEITVPEGIEVELTGLPLMGGKHLRVADVPVVPGTPTVHVRAYPIMGGVQVRSRRRGQRGSGGDNRDHAGAIEAARREWEPLAAEWWRDDWDPVPAGLRHEQPGDAAVSEVPAGPDGTVTILFSDVAGSTAMNERLGDVRAVDILRAHTEIVRSQVAAHNGHEVKTQGDGVMVAFSSANRAVRAAIAIQRGVDAWSDKHPDAAFEVHLGLHTGEAIREENDYLGQAVILASRITSQAAPGEILVSSLLKELAESAGEFEFGPARDVTLKGLSGGRRVYPVTWRDGGDGST